MHCILREFLRMPVSPSNLSIFLKLTIRTKVTGAWTIRELD